MKWEGPSISDYAARAGFVRPDLHTATAIALVGSAGLDHYDVAAGPPGTGRYVGLWALNVDEWPEYRADWLLNPANAARAAYELTKRVGGFGWSAVWRAGTERTWLDHAAQAATLPPYREDEHAPIASRAYADHLTQLRTPLRSVKPWSA